MKPEPTLIRPKPLLMLTIPVDKKPDLADMLNHRHDEGKVTTASFDFTGAGYFMRVTFPTRDDRTAVWKEIQAILK